MSYGPYDPGLGWRRTETPPMAPPMASRLPAVPAAMAGPARPAIPGSPPLAPGPTPPGGTPRTRGPRRRGAGAEPGDPGGDGPQPDGGSGGAPGGEAGPVEAVERFGTTEVPKSRSSFHVLTIVGQVEGHVVLPSQNKTTKYEHLLPQLVAIELNPDIEGLLVILNTVGGDVEAGLALAEMIATMSKPTVSLILGGGHSIGMPIAVAADYSFIAPTATMTIHPIRLSGLVIGVPQTYEYLDKMQDRVVRFVVANSRISEGRLRGLMFRTGELARDIGTVLVGEEAVSEGLIDAVGGVEHAISRLKDLAASGGKKTPGGGRPS